MINLDRFRKQNKELSKPLLVLVTDGFGLLAAIVEEKDSEIHIAAAARSDYTDPAEALIEVSGKLTFKYKQFPKQAIVIHAHAIPSILELAIDNIDALERSKIQELVRWEMESVFSDLVPHDNLGWLMIGLGYINERTRDELVRKLEAENSAGQKKIRIGEMAIRENYLTREQLETCLKTQDQLQLQDQRIKCGWSAQRNTQPVRWVSTAISNGIHEKWVNAFCAIKGRAIGGKTKLKRFYPFIGTASVQLPAVYGEDDCYVLELHRAYLAMMTYREGCLVQCLTLECSGDTPGLGDVEHLLKNSDTLEGSDVNVLVTHPDRHYLLGQLDELKLFQFKPLEKEVARPRHLPAEISSAEAILIAGAAHSYAGSNDQLLVPVQGEEPPPPVYRRPEASFGAVAVVMLICMGLSQLYFSWNLAKSGSRLDKLEEQYDRQQLIKKDLANSKKLQSQITSTRNKYNQLLALKSLMETVLVERQKFTGNFLDIIARNLNDNLVIDSINETDWNKFVIEGWALDQPSIDLYSTNLSRDLNKWDMYIAENPSSLGRNRSGIGGYKFRFVIQKRISNNSRTRLNLTMQGQQP